MDESEEVNEKNFPTPSCVLAIKVACVALLLAFRFVLQPPLLRSKGSPDLEPIHFTEKMEMRGPEGTRLARRSKRRFGNQVKNSQIRGKEAKLPFISHGEKPSNSTSAKIAAFVLI